MIMINFNRQTETIPIAEAVRILRPGGTLVICDADFAKATMGVVPGDPLGSCAEAFVAGSVTDPKTCDLIKTLVTVSKK